MMAQKYYIFITNKKKSFFLILIYGTKKNRYKISCMYATMKPYLQIWLKDTEYTIGGNVVQ